MWSDSEDGVMMNSVQYQWSDSAGNYWILVSIILLIVVFFILE